MIWSETMYDCDTSYNIRLFVINCEWFCIEKSLIELAL